ncbi:hypothetical protein AQUCO_01300454v1 [Aquilegia coerulea]|uniref:Glucose-methanol-choline oxidoreductase N-terminal domain-containing protein n=1 Tax=Aquilegia coerulea TaxID=218851 RepID=A0A2G5E1T8_AQUCA|nr:hypothetical protein AQUCO_01300454v1 [Aquilegia coerulea]
MDLSWCRFVGALVVAILLCLQGFCYSEQAPNYSFVHDSTSAPNISYYDYIIIGGGTAGCPLAATLSQNYSVLLIERGGSPYGFYTRASVDYVNNAGWDGNLVNQSYQWVEKLVAFEPPMRQWQSAVRDGLLEVGVTPYNGFTYDHIIGTKVGGTIFDRDGHRHTAADLLEYANPKGLTVLLNATVHQILFRTKGKAKPTAHGVIFSDSLGIKHRAQLNKGSKNEIILSAGALGSPQLLMLSGVGPAEHLRSHNITVLVDQPMVGQGMSDNPMNAIYIPSPLDVEVSLIQVVGITPVGSYIEAASGANFGSPAGMQSFGMFEPQTGELFTVRSDQSNPGMAKFFEAMKPADRVFRGGFILEKVLGPSSTGHLELRNKNPHDNPSVRFNYFQDPEDLRRCAEGIRIISRVIASRAFSKFTYPYLSFPALVNMTLSFPVNMLPKHNNVTSSHEQFCRDSVMTIWHYHGGNQVGKVVDNDYKVLGVDALRVIDGSTFQYSPGTNPQATVMMLGRYMGVKIANDRVKSDGSS